MTVYMKLRPRRGIYQVGDRVPWCEGCYGEIVAMPHSIVVIRTDDGVDRTTSEDDLLQVEAALAKRGVVWK